MMLNVDVTKMSSKGQVVIPQDMREGINVGEKFVIIKNGHEFILKPVKDAAENFSEDVDFAKKTLAALERYGKGKFIEKSEDEFLSELEKW